MISKGQAFRYLILGTRINRFDFQSHIDIEADIQRRGRLESHWKKSHGFAPLPTSTGRFYKGVNELAVFRVEIET